MSADTERSEPGTIEGFCATRILKRPPITIGQIGDFTFPRPVRLVTLAVAAAGMIVGLILGVALVPVVGPAAILWGPGVCITAAVTLVSWSPLSGESFARWATLTFSGAARRRGRRLPPGALGLYVGVAPVPRITVGDHIMVSGAVPVDPRLYDHRGVRLPDEVVIRAGAGR